MRFEMALAAGWRMAGGEQKGQKRAKDTAASVVQVRDAKSSDQHVTVVMKEMDRRQR